MRRYELVNLIRRHRVWRPSDVLGTRKTLGYPTVDPGLVEVVYYPVGEPQGQRFEEATVLRDRVEVWIRPNGSGGNT